ncbi:MAG TPA: hypothetical protein VKA61_02360, partial [Sphingomicrobium sp.]|nr:hypothetical protein [Sphingomicrobium sp.]
VEHPLPAVTRKGLESGSADFRVVELLCRPEGATYQEAADHLQKDLGGIGPFMFRACAKAGVRVFKERQNRMMRFYGVRG